MPDWAGMRYLPLQGGFAGRPTTAFRLTTAQCTSAGDGSAAGQAGCDLPWQSCMGKSRHQQQREQDHQLLLHISTGSGRFQSMWEASAHLKRPPTLPGHCDSMPSIWSAYLMLMGATLAGRLASCSNRYMMDRVTIPSSESPATQCSSAQGHYIARYPLMPKHCSL